MLDTRYSSTRIQYLASSIQIISRMLTYIIKRTLHFIPLLIGISFISFAVIHLAPGKPSDLVTNLNPKVSLEARAQMNKLYGLDKPITQQFKLWLTRMIRLDFGDSFSDGRKVVDKIKERLPVTLIINIISIILILIMLCQGMTRSGNL